MKIKSVNTRRNSGIRFSAAFTFDGPEIPPPDPQCNCVKVRVFTIN